MAPCGWSLHWHTVGPEFAVQSEQALATGLSALRVFVDFLQKKKSDESAFLAFFSAALRDFPPAVFALKLLVDRKLPCRAVNKFLLSKSSRGPQLVTRDALAREQHFFLVDFTFWLGESLGTRSPGPSLRSSDKCSLFVLSRAPAVPTRPCPFHAGHYLM